MKRSFKYSLILIVLLFSLVVADDTEETEETTTVYCESPVDIMLVLDHSGSILDSQWEKISAFVDELMDQFQVDYLGAHMGITQFATQAETTMCLTGSRCAIDMGMEDNPDIGFTTNMKDALEAGQQEIEDNGRTGDTNHHIIILLTDGHDNVNTGSDLMEAANEIKKKGTSIYCIGVQNEDTDKEQMMATLNAISTDPTEDYVEYVENGFDGLETTLGQIVDSECSEIVRTKCSSALILLTLLVLFHLYHLIAIYKEKPLAKKIATYSHYSLILFIFLIFCFACALANSDNGTLEKSLCIAMIIFLSFSIVSVAVVTFFLWRNRKQKVEKTLGISKAGLSTLEHGGQTPSGMNAFRKEETKTNVGYAELKEHLDGQFMYGDEDEDV
ncbi:anthrax toxin receptor-like [Anaeramoeba flamelloides]|uniref:Anthrax toxin receptor-like n=1 Tax=Anaeramoeba flamelloides TaxID=1746091 RepID=A0AAV7Y1V7_9EUKA|nr:anthrax toxin receptor-like [Anaeramoeba flamelloides]